MKKYELPTGILFVDDYSNGQLETLSIGDYGKSKNIKADFLGHSRELNGVENGDIMPLQEKWVITLSTQYGCAMKCDFCDVPKVKFKGNASFEDLQKQLFTAISLFPDVHYTDRLNVHYARMGDPIFNPAVLQFTEYLWNNKRSIQNQTGLRVEVIHPVFTTMCPTYKHTSERLHEYVKFKNNVFNGQAGLQLSINSTSNEQRDEMFNGMNMSLEQISYMVQTFPKSVGRKYCLNFAYASGNECDGEYLATLFNPGDWMVKITPIHNNNACMENGIKTVDGYDSYHPYKEAEQSFIDAGFDTLIFIPSMDEEKGLITCGNAVLGGSQFGLEVL